jgi:hypothetical protein
MPHIELSGKLGHGKVTLVDDSTLKKYGNLTWHLSDTGYVVRRNKSEGGTVRLHRLVTKAPEGMVVDHLNGDKLDNRLSNLRVCTQAENSRNRKNTTGICFDKNRNKWIVRYRNKFYGRYETEEEASRAYQKAKSGVEYAPKRRQRYMLPYGVTFYKGYKKPYAVRPQVNGVRHFLGYFATAEEAKTVYDNFRQKEK